MGGALTSKLMSAAETTAVTIIEKMKTFREFLPEFLHDDLDWCIKEIRNGQIYSESGASDLFANMEGANELRAIFQEFDDNEEKRRNFQDEKRSKKLTVRR